MLIRQLIWAGVRTGLPLQFHVGHRRHRTRGCTASIPAYLHEFLLATQHSGTAVMLLHCYPYHRQAAVLSNIFPHVYMDVGEALNHVGARSAAVLAEALEVVPFHKHAVLLGRLRPGRAALPGRHRVPPGPGRGHRRRSSPTAPGRGPTVSGWPS